LIAWIVGAIVALVGFVLAGLVLFTAWTAYQVEKRLPPRGRFIDVDGARIHYIDEGTGPTLLLVHGLSAQMLCLTHSLLGRLKPHFRVVILDRPGNGYSTLPPNVSPTLSNHARIISRFCEELKLGRPLVVGHSLGGAIALALALNHPKQVAGLALLAPATHRPDQVPAPFDGIAIASPLRRRLIAWTLATPLTIANREQAMAVLFGPEPVAPDFAIRGGGLLNLRPRSFITASAEVMATGDELAEMPARYKDLAVPVGILYGSGDRVLDPAAQGKALAAKVKGADLELIDGGGHMIPITSPDRTAAFIARMAQRAATSESKVAPMAQPGS
jgi:pimeloyl-ACP methyl ester carboxylesterase